jgi:hypothetical protein
MKPSTSGSKQGQQEYQGHDLQNRITDGGGSGGYEQREKEEPPVFKSSSGAGEIAILDQPYFERLERGKVILFNKSQLIGINLKNSS